MTDKFYPLSIDKLYHFIFSQKGEILGFPENEIFCPDNYKELLNNEFGQPLATPIGVAAGPHSQMAQNIIAAWLNGARYLELKTIQTLDELQLAKPCIDMQDEGYNCEWSQELKVKQSFEEYLKAWILVHVLSYKLWKHKTAGTIFNMSVGYNMDGILNENVQWFFNKMANCETEKNAMLHQLCSVHPCAATISIPNTISNNITLSTMHGCPPDEIERIGMYLIKERKLHTIIKLNPTLLGAEELRKILNKELGFQTQIPDIAFEHDLKFQQAKHIITTLQDAANKAGVHFGIKLTNTLESLNNKQIFTPETEMMYMSGRALHPISVAVAHKLQKEFNGKIPISFSAGVDAFNVSEILACNMHPVTVCSDLLKPAGYLRLNQYIKNISTEFKNVGANSLQTFIEKKTNGNALQYLDNYANECRKNEAYKNTSKKEKSIKTKTPLNYFDCIAAPCVTTCPTNQNIPAYLRETAKGNFDKALKIITERNSLPNITGTVCDQSCQMKCTRINYDNPLKIREIKNFLAKAGNLKKQEILHNPKFTVAIVGAGAAGLSCAYYLAKQGIKVEVFEKNSKAGGMVSLVIPRFRLSYNNLTSDIQQLQEMGVSFHFNKNILKEDFENLRKQFDYVFVGTGAPVSRKMGIEGENAEGVYDALVFLEKANKNENIVAEKNISIIGGGNTAIDAARTAKRLFPKASVDIIYRRTINEMPASEEEILAAEKDGIVVKELFSPIKIEVENNKVVGLVTEINSLNNNIESGRKTVKGTNKFFHFALDTIIVAIGQDTENKWFKETKNPEFPFATQHQNVFVGGDYLRGPATIIQAVADGRKVAEKMLIANGITLPENEVSEMDLTISQLKIHKAKRNFGFQNSNEIFTEQQAKEEAARCLNCDVYCSICSSVCPNTANFTYNATPFETENTEMQLIDNKWIIKSSEKFKISQKTQILNIFDFCNECGNCSMFCPTSGRPFADKPRVVLSQEAWHNTGNVFQFANLVGKKILKYKSESVEEPEISTLCLLNNEYTFENDDITAIFSETDKKIKSFTPKHNGFKNYNLHKVFEMMVIMEGAEKI